MMADAAAAEWLKLRTVRSTYVVLGVVLVFMGVGLLVAWQAVVIWEGASPERRAHFHLAEPADLVTWVGGLCMGVLGVLSITSEYRTGMIRTTFAVMPARPAVLAAKAAMVGAVALAAGHAVTLGTFLGTRLIIGDRPIPGFGTAVARELPELLVQGCLVPVYALLGMGLAVLLRSAAAAIIGIVLPWYLLPILTGLLPGPWGKRVSSFAPDALPQQVLGGDNAASIYGALLPPAAAVAVMIAYAALPLGAAAFTLRNRDA